MGMGHPLGASEGLVPTPSVPLRGRISALSFLLHSRFTIVNTTVKAVGMGDNLQWGFGAASLVKPSTKEDIERIAFIPDIHIPYQDESLVSSALRFVRRVKPHRVVLLGDLVDFHSISRWNSAQERLDDLQDELDEAQDFLARLRKASGDAPIELVEGNHDLRMRTYVAENARALTSLRSLKYEQLLGLQDHRVNYYPGHGFLLRPNFVVKHGNMIRKGSGQSAKAEALAANASGISGHTHRLGRYRLDGYAPLEWWEAGTLSRVDAPYVVGPPDWEQGMVYGHFAKNGQYLLEALHTMDGKLFYGGRSY